MKNIWKKRKKLIITLAIIVVLIIVAVVAVRKKVSDMVESGNTIQLQSVGKQDMSDFISLTGTVTGENQINYTSTAESQIKTINVKVGDEVKAGDVIATLDQEAIQSQITLLEKSVANANALSQNQLQQNKNALDTAKKDRQAQLSQAKKQIESANSEYTDAQNTYNSLKKQLDALKEQKNQTQAPDTAEDLNMQISGLQSQVSEASAAVKAAKSAVDEAYSNYDSVDASTRQSVESAQNTIDMEKYSQETDTSSKTQLESLRKQLQECTITCQADGIVTAVNVSAGSVNTPGATIVTVENNHSMIMTASVKETDILKLQEGMKAVVTADALDDQEIPGEVIKVVRVYNGASAAASAGDSGHGNTQTESAASASGYSVQIRLGESALLSGMSAKAKITITDKENILSVPYDLVQENEDGSNYVLCAEENKDGSYTAVKRTVVTGDEVNYYTEIKSGDFTINTENRRLFILDQEINVTSKEFDMLLLLVTNPGKVYSRDELLRAIWGEDYPGDARTVDVHIRRLREKIEPNASEPKYVHTKWGVGYYYQQV